VQSIKVNESNADDTVDIENNFSIPITIQMGNGMDVVNIDPTSKIYYLENTNRKRGLSADVIVRGGAGVDTLNVFDQNDPSTLSWTLTDSRLSNSNFSSSSIDFSRIGFVNLYGSASGVSTFTGIFRGDFDPTLKLTGFSGGALDVTGNFNGQLIAPDLGTPTTPVQHINIGGAVTARADINVKYVNTLDVGGDLAGSVNAGRIGTMSVAKDLSGTVTITGSLQSLHVGGNLTGTVSAAIIGASTIVRTVTGQTHGTGSIFVLSPTANGALTLTGNGSINTPGSLIVDSASSSAIVAKGNATVAASGGVFVMGGVSTTGQAHVQTPAGPPASTADPLAGLPAPSTAALTNYIAAGSGDVKLRNNATMTLGPGIYSRIRVLGNATLLLLPGIYYLAGGGLTVTGSARLVMAPPSTPGYQLDPITGAGVLIYNTSSPSDPNSYGSITLEGTGTVNLKAATAGTYAGLLIYQDPNNGRTISLNGHSSAGMTGIIYAPRALLDLDGQGTLTSPLIVSQLSLTGNTVAQLVGSSSGTVHTPAQTRAAYGINPLSATGPEHGFLATPAPGYSASASAPAASALPTAFPTDSAPPASSLLSTGQPTVPTSPLSGLAPFTLTAAGTAQADQQPVAHTPPQATLSATVPATLDWVFGMAHEGDGTLVAPTPGWDGHGPREKQPVGSGSATGTGVAASDTLFFAPGAQAQDDLTDRGRSWHGEDLHRDARPPRSEELADLLFARAWEPFGSAD
jgi:hypothetical protein